jgi:hypothetical protein
MLLESPKGSKNPVRGDHSELVLVSHLDSRSAGSTLDRGESSSRAEESGEDGELHLVVLTG